jgi:hypothetical protein
MIDVDPKKCGKTYANHRCVPLCVIPVVHFTEFSEFSELSEANDAARLPPVVVCVAKRRKGPGEVGDLVGRLSSSMC